MTIISDKSDITTNKVCEFGLFYEWNLNRINQEDSQLESEMLSSLSIISWLRRGNFPASFEAVSKQELMKEYQFLSRYFHYLAEQNINCLGSLVKEYDHNKLIDLHKAKSVGLSVPETHIVCTKAELVDLFSKSKNWITKSIKDPIAIQENDKHYSAGFTSRLTESILDELPETFYPSLIQEEIEKEVELRISYLKGRFYSMAIFSQNDKQTAIDYRHYNDEKPNRNVPYQIPETIKAKLNQLMQKLELNTGSIDVILSKKNEYVFLEVNPVGQLDWVSGNCNYYVERKIANMSAIADIITEDKSILQRLFNKLKGTRL